MPTAIECSQNRRGSMVLELWPEKVSMISRLMTFCLICSSPRRRTASRGVVTGSVRANAAELAIRMILTAMAGSDLIASATVSSVASSLPVSSMTLDAVGDLLLAHQRGDGVVELFSVLL